MFLNKHNEATFLVAKMFINLYFLSLILLEPAYCQFLTAACNIRISHLAGCKCSFVCSRPTGQAGAVHYGLDWTGQHRWRPFRPFRAQQICLSGLHQDDILLYFLYSLANPSSCCLPESTLPWSPLS